MSTLKPLTIRKIRNLFRGTFIVLSLVFGALCLSALRADDPHFVQTNLVSNISGLAKITDAELVNSWGVSHSPTSPSWVPNQGTNTTTLYAFTIKTNTTKRAITPQSGSVLTPP